MSKNWTGRSWWTFGFYRFHGKSKMPEVRPQIVMDSQVEPRRIFVGWDEAILPRVVEQLVQRFRASGTCDMREIMIVLPGGLARRRLIELLTLRAQLEGVILYPPRTVTIGALPEQLYVAKFPFAGELVQNLAWVEALQAIAPTQLQCVVPVPPQQTASQQWLELGKMLAGLHRELASDGLDFEQVSRALGDGHPESTRWQALAEIQRAYHAKLDSLELWDVQTARLRALDWGEASVSQQIIVVGCVDLNSTQRRFLQAVAERVEVWIGAPPAEASRFDALGGLISSMWQDMELELPPDCMFVGNSPQDQAQLVSACLAEWTDELHIREVTVGAADSSLVPELKRELDQCSVPARYGAGTALALTEPVQLIVLLARYVDARKYSDFAALVRHPAFENLLRVTKAALPDDWLSQLDRYYRATLCKTVDGTVVQNAEGAEVFGLVTKILNRWLGKLKSRRQRVSLWVQPLLAVLNAAYQRKLCDLEDSIDGPLYQSASKTAAAIIALRELPDGLEPSLTLVEMVDWLVRSLAGQLIPEPSSAEAVEILGWLELALDDAPALVLAGMHDGVVPESVNADSFLPNAIRKQLGVMDNARRYARDMYSLQVMCHARQKLRIVVGKTDAVGDPLVPSRLLMACPLAQLPARVLHLVSEVHADVLPPVQSRWLAASHASGDSQSPGMIVPRPQNRSIPSSITVTAFRDYLACPYRYYLRHVLKLRSEDDSVEELDAANFGVLLHETVDLLGRSPLGSSSDEAEVRRFLIESLHTLAEQKYGSDPPATVLIQIEQAELRLEAFAAKQAQRAADGWEIRHVESSVKADDMVMCGIGDKLLKLIGRIDRIDYHPATGRWAIWDYKTSESAKNPVSVHWSSSKGWTDLQLPLYVRLAERLGVTGTPSLGYISIPKQAQDTGFFTADFTAAQLSEANSRADEVASQVACGEFWPEKLADVQYDDFGRICQTGVQRVAVPRPVRKLNRFSNSATATAWSTISADVLSAAQQRLRQPIRSDVRFQPQVIRASAGTGKTFQLSNRLLQILLAGHEVDHILATTFTRKAAGEILHRVLQRLASACLDPAELQQLGKHLPDVDASLPACLACLKRVTASIHRLRISTLDSFFAQVARTFTLEMGLPPGWNAMDPLQEPQFQMEAIGKMLDSHDRQTLVTLVRMLAKGESSRQVAEQIRQTVSAGYGAFRATSEEAWDQLPLPPVPSETATESALQTLESTQIGDKRADGLLQRLHLDGSAGRWESVIEHGIYKKLDEDPPTYFRKPLSAGLVTALRVLAERAAGELLPVRRNQTLASYRVLDAYDAQYTAQTKRQRLLAFSDVAYYLSGWMTADDSLPTGRVGIQQQLSESSVGENSDNSNAARTGKHRMEFRMDCAVEHLLLDEFQDTAPEQWNVLEPLAKPLGGASSSKHSFFCVGDIKQAIYGWRGGVAEIFDTVNRSVAGVKREELRDSYRSSAQVMRVVNQVFQHLPNHENFAGCEAMAARWSREFPEHRTTRVDLSGYVRLQNTLRVPHDVPPLEREEQLLWHAADQIADLTAKTDASIGVLFRTNADVGRMIAMLRQRNVSASQDGGNPLTDSAAVQLVLSLVRLADHPGDRTSAFHIRTSPLVAKLPEGMATKPYELASWFRLEVSRRGLAEAVGTIADMIAGHVTWWDQHRLQQLVRSAEQFQLNYHGRLRAFEESVMADRVALPSDAQVKVMTIHRSKGLEFDAVFLPDLVIDLAPSTSLLVMRGEDPCLPPNGVVRYMNANLQRMLPDDWQQAFTDHRQRGVTESLCLLYVAMTRARRALYMFSRPTSSGPSQEFGSVLQSTLSEKSLVGQAEAVLHEDGDPSWYESSSVKAAVAADSAIPTNPQTVRLRRDLESAPARGLRIAKPSGVHQVVDRVPLSSAFSFSRSAATTYGTLIHAYFQQIQWLDDYRIDRVELRRIALATIDPDDLRHLPLAQTMDDFEEMLQLSSVRSALGRSRYKQPLFGQIPDSVTVDNERPISLIMDGRIVAGTIDRLAILSKDGQPYAAEIIDFKTDKFDPSMTLLWLEERLEHHRPQMDVYARVVSQLFNIPLERIATYLVMLSTDDLALCDRTVNSNVASPPHWNSRVGDASAAGIAASKGT